MVSKTAYATLLCNGDGYATGVEVLGKSLELSGSTIPRVAMVTADIGASVRERLKRRGWALRDVAAIEQPTSDKPLYARFSAVFTKLRAWQLCEFERVVFLDADTLVLKNIDALFERSHFAAAPDFFMPDRFNSGVMVLEPSEATFAAMMQALPLTATYDGGDQGFLNSYFSNWYAMPVEQRLPVGMNMPHFIYQFMRGHAGLKATLEREANVVHYMLQKPWLARVNLTGGSEAWWNLYFAAYPEKASAWRHRVHSFEDWTFDHLERMLIG
jgi:lipopolysaccharide biosynthesis glycosyltransferase